MIVMNRATAKIFSVTPHAKSRFNERGDIQQGDLMTRLCRSVPYGGQQGDGMLLIDDDVVFVAKIKDSVIVTCLTKDQAIANMQQHRQSLFAPIKFTEPAKAVVAKPKPEPVLLNPNDKEIVKLKREIVKLDRNRCLLKIAMDEVLTQKQVQEIYVRAKELKAQGKDFSETVV